jgi:hypothetical protein
MRFLDSFAEIWLCDFEFHAPAGECPEPICVVAREHRTGATIRLWGDELTACQAPPFAVGDDTLFVAYYASAELGCFLALGWTLPTRILDLCAEFKCQTSGLSVPCGRGLLGALACHGLDAMGAVEKEALRNLAIRGGPYTPAELAALVDYCETDVLALDRLLPAMAPRIDLPRALLRGRYMAAAARIEWQGVPIDTETLAKIRENWDQIKSRLIAEVDREFGCYIPTGVTLDPSTKIGAAIMREADEWGIDAHRLADAVQFVWTEEREGHREHDDAIRDARRATGLTANRIARLEESGRDSSAFPRLDETARELAGELPALGIGEGYHGGNGADETDYAGRIWSLLREPSRRSAKDDPAILRRAAEMVADGNDADAGRSMTFSAARFANYLANNNIPWPRLESGALDLSDDTFKQMARSYPALAPLRELRHSLSQLRLNELAVGSDNRGRCLLSAFGSRTGRNQPSNSRFIFGPSVWLRGLIQPGPGRAVAYIDWEQQEFGIAGGLSGDAAMMAAYSSGDPYLAFAKQAGAVPADATKTSHKQERERFKVCALAVQYGMGELSLAQSLNQPEAYARDLLRLHRETYPRFWKWSQAAVDHAMLFGSLQAVFGWTVHVGPESNPRSLANFPMQANGAEMLRLACCLATERGIEVCAPVHDAILIEADADAVEQAVADCQQAMREASEIVLAGFALRADAKVIRHPERYIDPRGERMWETVGGLLETEKQGASF